MARLTAEPVGVRGLAIRAVLFKGTRDLLPIYALYGVLFADHGLSTAQISLLLALWSVTAFVLEVPSGAWADTVSRRGLLILSCVLQAVCFVLWMVAPSFLGFALGFVVWGVASSLESGTFEALIYDDLVARGETSSYARIMGWTRGAQESTVLLAILVAAPLFALGGYALVGWVSFGVAVLHTLTAFALPSAPVAISATAVDDLDDEPAMPGPHAVPGAAPVHAADPESARGLTRYLTMLRTGTSEALGVRRVRRGVLLGALLYGLTSFDEYFGLLAVSGGASTSVSALLVGVTVAGSLLGSLLAGRAEAVPARGLAAALFAAGVLFIAGALAVGAMSPVFLWAGFVGIGVAYGVDFTVEVVAGARLQDAIEGPARATVTSFSGLLSEIVALAVFGFVAVATQWLSMSTTIALFGIVLLVAALLIPSWLPPRK
ncbi:MFS transporter [Nocardia neocaledoniensis NBRC 108232]|uniref:Reduced folate carrier n=1 Tax=Nocardia neocaledoniensis TaxID=236511 RepID=A0A317NLR8_9NOCA|nr:MFS transporter [Nocardia neocaledoniensis]PWV76411.1 reduced folate carrier [Nocardia neocaledoniensis]GEM34683.1 MFS transporter [Nocardia neocaledoniensis NBRC 108232]